MRQVLLAGVLQSFDEIRFSPNVRRFFLSSMQVVGKNLAKGRVSSWLQTALALKFNIARVRSTMRSGSTIHAILKCITKLICSLQKWKSTNNICSL